MVKGLEYYLEQRAQAQDMSVKGMNFGVFRVFFWFYLFFESHLLPNSYRTRKVARKGKIKINIRLFRQA